MDRSACPVHNVLRVLLIEDFQVLQEALSKGFLWQGVVLDVVGDGADGLVLAGNNPYDVLILDLMLPGRNGTRVLHKGPEQVAHLRVGPARPDSHLPRLRQYRGQDASQDGPAMCWQECVARARPPVPNEIFILEGRCHGATVRVTRNS